MTLLPLWPTGMRQRGAAGVSGGPQTNIATFKPDIGPDIVRRRASSFVRNYDIDFNQLTLAEYEAFQTFFHDTLADGSLPFAWAHPMTDVLTKCRFTGPDGAVYTETRLREDFFALRFSVQFLSSVENEALDYLDGEPGTWLDFSTGKYAILTENNEVDTGFISGKLVFARSTTGTYVDVDGIIRTAAIDTPRYTYNPITHTALGIMSEELRTNILPHSENLSVSSLAGTTIVSNAITAPDGAMTGDALIEDTANSAHYVYDALTVVANTVYTHSRFVKAGARDKGNIYIVTAGFASGITAGFNLATGVISGTGVLGTGTVVGSSIEAFPNGWYRVSISGKVDASSTAVFAALALNNAAGSGSYIGDNSSGMWTWGRQVEVGGFPTSYIPTGASPVLRDTEFAYALVSSIPSNAAEHTLLADYIVPHNDTVNNSIALSLDDNTFDNVTNIYKSNTNLPVAVAVAATVTTAVISQSAIAAGVRIRTAFAAKTNDFAAYFNGVAGTPDTSGAFPVGLTRLHIGSLSGGYGWLNGPVRHAAHFPRRLANANLQARSVVPS